MMREREHVHASAFLVSLSIVSLLLLAGCSAETLDDEPVFILDDGARELIEKAADLTDMDVPALDDVVILLVNEGDECGEIFDYDMLDRIYVNLSDEDFEMFLLPCEHNLTGENALNVGNMTYEPEFYILKNPLARDFSYDSFWDFMVKTAPTHISSSSYGWSQGIYLVDAEGITRAVYDDIEYDTILQDVHELLDDQ